MFYDLFLSHSHADKEWTHALFQNLSRIEYDGRVLRAWLDEKVLDPGRLSSARELETALDRSNRLVLALTPHALASAWVQHELKYFLRTQASDRVVILERHACALPTELAGCTRIPWSGGPDAEGPMTALLKLLQPRADAMRRHQHGKDIRRAVSNAQHAMGSGFNPAATKEGERLFALLLGPELQNLDEEGRALTGFRPRLRPCPSLTRSRASTCASCSVRSWPRPNFAAPVTPQLRQSTPSPRTEARSSPFVTAL